MTMEITDRQMEIIEAAGRILTTSGISGLTTKNVAAEMKFTESAIYRHFKSKEDIIVAMLNYLAETMDTRLSAAVASANGPEERFKAVFRSQYGFFKAEPHFVVAVFSDGLMEQSQRINQAILKIMGTIMRQLMPIVMEGQQQQVFTNAISTEELLHIILGTFRLQMFKWRVANFGFDIERQSENMISALLTIIKHRS
ncbi:MAG: TetR/AcrR family transcriptional regulator [Flavobacteriales bacterium]|nr:TetR/AcrR family transcriptional regulator [Flavobacteriales bacterium]